MAFCLVPPESIGREGRVGGSRVYVTDVTRKRGGGWGGGYG